MEKTRDKRWKMHWERFLLNTRNKCFTVSRIIHRNNLPRDMVGSYHGRFSRCKLVDTYSFHRQFFPTDPTGADKIKCIFNLTN